MHPKDQLNADLKEAMKSHDPIKVTLLRSTLAAFKDSEQRKREDMVKAALKKHAVARPTSSDEGALAAFDKAVTAALAAEKIADNVTLDEAEGLSLIQKLIKQRQDSIAEAQKAGRTDIVESETHEMDVLQAYLPQQMSREEIEAEAKQIIAQVGAASAKDMGKVMGPLTGKLKGRADGKLISEVVRALLP
jgi:uncharacterized protein YqeY